MNFGIIPFVHYVMKKEVLVWYVEGGDVYYLLNQGRKKYDPD